MRSDQDRAGQGRVRYEGHMWLMREPATQGGHLSGILSDVVQLWRVLVSAQDHSKAEKAVAIVRVNPAAVS